MDAVVDTEDLVIKIETLREKMVSAGLSKGFSSPETIRLSENLDTLLNIQLKKSYN